MTFLRIVETPAALILFNLRRIIIDAVIIAFVFDEYMFSDPGTCRRLQTPRRDANPFFIIHAIKQARAAKPAKSALGKI